METTDHPRAGAPASGRLWALYLGGFMGPFAGALVNSIFPELADGLGTDLHTASLSMTAYMVPFAVMMLFSGTLAEKWGRGRTVRWGFIAFTAASVVCMFATTAPVFMAGRGAAGIANAFTTPLLITMIADTIPPARLGRALGTFASMQAFGQAVAPLAGGIAATWDYRWAFAANAVVAAALAIAMPAPPHPPRPPRHSGAPLRTGGSHAQRSPRSHSNSRAPPSW